MMNETTAPTNAEAQPLPKIGLLDRLGIDARPHHERFPETAAALERINARHAALETERKRKFEQERVKLLSKTQEGRIQLARQATALAKKRDEINRLKNAARPKSEMRDQIRQRNAEKREAAVQLAAIKKQEQASQGRGSK